MTTSPASDPRLEIHERVLTVLAGLREDMAPALVAAEDLHGRLVESSAGGKAFRARLLLAAFEACGGHDRDAALDLAAALELFQTAALIHDDVLDGSDTRRGRPSAHRAFEADHAALALAGSGEDYGRAAAILAGDVALVAAQHAATAASARVGPRASDLFARMAALVTAGQHLDMRVAVTPVDSLDALEGLIRAVMRSKTASYTAEYPLALGAAAAQADDATVDALARAGVPLGIAFQLRDDVLGLTGSAADTGKPVGDDIREGKRTLLVWHALAHGDADQRGAVLDALGRKDADAPTVAAAITAMEASGAFTRVEEEISTLAAQAREALVAAAAHPDGLLALVDAAARRTA